jgi:hypothetical protein
VYEGHDARNANIKRAGSIISKAVWPRNTPHYTFDEYCNKHIQKNELNCYKANLDGQSHVRYFLDGIKLNDRDKRSVAAIKVIIEQQPHTKGDLLHAIISFKDSLRNN